MKNAFWLCGELLVAIGGFIAQGPGGMIFGVGLAFLAAALLKAIDGEGP